MRCKTWIPLGSLILLLCAQQGDATLILGSMLMAATAAMTGGLIMGPLTIGGLIMMMMMANQNAQQRTQGSTGTNHLAFSLENSQNLLNLLSSLTGAASNLGNTLATSASNQQLNIATTNSPKASKRALYDPQNLEELLAASSRSTSRVWKSVPDPTPQPRETSSAFLGTDFWNKPAFSPDTGFAVEPIPDDLLDIAMRLPQAKSANMFDFDTTTAPPSTASPAFADMMDLAPPRPITSKEQLRWVASEPGDLFSSFPEARENDFFNFVHKRSIREAVESKFRLEDIANVTYANEKDPAVKQKMEERAQQETLNTRILRQLSALDPFRCLPQLACNIAASPPSQQSGILNDYAYLMKTVFEREDADDEEDDIQPQSSTTKKSSSSNTSNKGLAVELADLLSQTMSGSKKKKMTYKSPSKQQSSGEKLKSNKDRKDDDDDDDFSSEEIPMDDDEVDRLMLKEQYEMEQTANEELLNDDPDLLPYILKSASKAPPYLGPDNKFDPSAHHAAELAQAKAKGAQSFRGSPTGFAEGPGTYVQPAPLFNPSMLSRYRTEDLNKLSESELNNLLRQVSYPGETYLDEETAPSSISGMFSRFLPKMPEMSMGFSRRRTTGNTAFDDDPFFDDFDFKKRSLDPAGPKVSNVRRIVRKARDQGPGGRIAYLRKMKRTLSGTNDPAEIFRMATEAGAKVKSPRQCRFLFNSCPMNSTQLLGMIGGIRNAVLNLSGAQQLLAGIQTTASPPPARDIEGSLATIGPNVVKYPETHVPPQPTTQAPPYPMIHQLQPMQSMPVPAQQSTSQNTLVVPQIIQVPMPIGSHAPAAQPIIMQQPMPIMQPQMSMMQMQPQQMPLMQQQQPQVQQMNHNNHRNPGVQMHPIFNVPTDSSSSSAGASLSSGGVSISQELPSGEKLEISMKLMGNNGEVQTNPNTFQLPLPTATKKKASSPLTPFKPTIPQSSDIPITYRPVVGTNQPASVASSLAGASKIPAADLVDLFDDDVSVLLPTKTLIETEIKPPTTSIDSLHAAMLAIEKINQAANERPKVRPIRPLSEDDERDETLRPPPKVKPGLRLPSRPKNKKKQKPADDGDDDDTSEEDDDEEDDEDAYRKIPDPMDPKKRDFVPVPTRMAQFSSTMTVPATQTFAKKQLQVEPTHRPASTESGSSEEPTTTKNNNRRMMMANSGSSEEDDLEEQRQQQRRLLSKRRIYRRPKILYPQDDVEKPLFIPL